MDDKQSQIKNAVYKMLGIVSADNAYARKMSALLRHSADKMPGEDPELFGWLMANIPEELQAYGGDISKEEWAIFTALTLYPSGAAHSLSNISIADAAALAGVTREKLVLIETADNLGLARQPLRALLQLLRAKGQSIDYAVLATDLYAWQWDKIRTARKWERDYARKEKINEQ